MCGEHKESSIVIFNNSNLNFYEFLYTESIWNRNITKNKIINYSEISVIVKYIFFNNYTKTSTKLSTLFKWHMQIRGQSSKNQVRKWMFYCTLFQQII